VANSLFGAYKQVLMGDSAAAGFSVPDLEAGDQRLVLLDTALHATDVALDQDLADVDPAARVAVSPTLASPAVLQAGGVAAYETANATFTSVSGDQAEELLLYAHTGTDATSLLIVRYDTFSAGMPLTPNGGDVLVNVPAAGWFYW
jgi:hypothetical protein